jgi:hypothetical protein
MKLSNETHVGIVEDVSVCEAQPVDRVEAVKEDSHPDKGIGQKSETNKFDILFSPWFSHYKVVTVGSA